LQSCRLLLLVAFAVSLSACTNSTTASDSGSPAPVDSGLAAVATGSAEPSAGNDSTSSPGTEAVALASPATHPSFKLKTVALTDIDGTSGQKAIVDLAELGVIEPATGAFHPHAPLTRATFVRWLVKANNAEFISDVNMIRPTETADSPTFVDVPPSQPDYKYIQGMADAGFVIGIDAKHFAPSRNITREELIAIYQSRVSDAKIPPVTSVAGMGIDFTDADKISKPYWGAFNQAWYGFYKLNIQRIFGDIKTFHPQRPATRAEAAIAVSVIKNADAASTLAATSHSQ
jgi:hypothetical protein